MTTEINNALDGSAYQRRWAAENRDKITVYAKRYGAKVQADPVRRAARNAATAAGRAVRMQDPEYREAERLRSKRRRESPERWAVTHCADIKRRAAEKGLACDLSADALLAALPADMRCPILGEPFVFGEKSPLNPSVDRLRPSGDYTVSNIRIISQEMNLVKRTCTDPDTLRRLADWMERELAAPLGEESRRAA